ncbi:MAG: 6-phosphogluconolactonase [Kordiimonadaceae bacterium]|jgi:6-phosphogluconolactonase|nr:6-phosphogluconolactonase [Kordiimonadaceae bacterium]
MKKITENIFESREELVSDLCAEIISKLSQSIDERQKASMLLSGGSTPGPLYDLMSKQEMNWKNVYFSVTDERWLETNHQDSNERLVRATLLQNKAASANYVSLKSNQPTPHMGQKDTEQNFADFPFPIDIVLLGMGEDGHMASLFPNIEDSQKAMDKEIKYFCHAIKREEGDVDRMTVTLNGLLKSKRIILYFYGQKKLDVYNKAKELKSDSLPISYLLHQDKVPISLYWAE